MPAAPWRLHQNYPRDVLLMRHGRLTDEGVRFSRAPRRPGRDRPPPSATTAARRPRADFVFAGGTAVVTGAASGIGEALAYDLAGRGSDLVLLDRDADRLDPVAAGSGRPPGPRGRHATWSTSPTPTATARVAARDPAAHPRVRLLVNNAGVALGGRFDQVTSRSSSWVINVNFRALVQLTHALLPALKAEPGAHLVNVSSLFGLIAPAGQTAYAASKFAVRGLHRGAAARAGRRRHRGHLGASRAASAPASRETPGSAAASPAEDTRPAARSSRSC